MYDGDYNEKNSSTTQCSENRNFPMFEWAFHEVEKASKNVID